MSAPSVASRKKAAPAKSPAAAPKRAAVRPAPVAVKKNPGAEALMYGLTFLIIGGIGYVGWRTQVKGERIDAVLPFLASSQADDAAQAEAAAQAESAAEAEAAAAAAKSKSSENTVFGRRTGGAPTRDFGYRP